MSTRSYYNEHKNLVELESVGSWFDEVTKMVYPMMKNGEYFEDEGISIYDDEMNEEWWSLLSPKDYQEVTGQEFHSNPNSNKIENFFGK